MEEPMSDNFPMPGKVEFSADEEKAMRASSAANRQAGQTPPWTYTPKGLAVIQGANIGSNLPDDATDRQ
jgi:hypothetical protein